MSDTNLFAAHNQWATRPADERFETLADLYLNCWSAYQTAETQDLAIRDLEIINDNGELKVASPAGVLSFNNWSFTQLAGRVGAPSGFLQELAPNIAADALNYRIKRSTDKDAQLYFDTKSRTMRAVTSQRYGRILNHEVVKAVIDLPGNWVTPPARPAAPNQPGARLATEADCKSSTLIKPGDLIAPAGLYGSDRDMFAFLVDPDTRISDGTDEGLSRGFFIRNSEVGNATFSLTMFYYRYVCGNHIVWGASDVKTFSIKHLGRNAKGRAFDKLDNELVKYVQASALEDEAAIKVAKDKELGSNEDDLVELLYEQKRLLGQKDVKEAYLLAQQHADTDGNPRSAWGMSSGVTRLSQSKIHQSERDILDKAAGKILALAK